METGKYGNEPPPPYTAYPGEGFKSEPAPNQYTQPMPAPPQHGFVSYPSPQSYGAATNPVVPPTSVTVQPVSQVIVVGGCPACRVGVLEDDYTCCGIFCAIFCFPLGILCCLATKQRRCPNCGAIFG